VLEKGKSNWQDFQKAGPKKTGFGQPKNLGKDSMFRTPDLPGAKGKLSTMPLSWMVLLTHVLVVGFTGSGKGMKKDQARTTWKFSGPTEDPNF
jgi:survival-of-motor-neuron-related-splicing factor 30